MEHLSKGCKLGYNVQKQHLPTKTIVGKRGWNGYFWMGKSKDLGKQDEDQGENLKGEMCFLPELPSPSQTLKTHSGNSEHSNSCNNAVFAIPKHDLPIPNNHVWASRRDLRGWSTAMSLLKLVAAPTTTVCSTIGASVVVVVTGLELLSSLNTDRSGVTSAEPRLGVKHKPTQVQETYPVGPWYWSPPVEVLKA